MLRAKSQHGKRIINRNMTYSKQDVWVFTTMDNGTTPNSTAMLPRILNRHRKIGLSKVPQSDTNNLGPGRNGSDTELIPAPGLLTAVKPAKHTRLWTRRSTAARLNCQLQELPNMLQRGLYLLFAAGLDRTQQGIPLSTDAVSSQHP